MFDLELDGGDGRSHPGCCRPPAEASITRDRELFDRRRRGGSHARGSHPYSRAQSQGRRRAACTGTGPKTGYRLAATTISHCERHLAVLPGGFSYKDICDAARLPEDRRSWMPSGVTPDVAATLVLEWLQRVQIIYESGLLPGVRCSNQSHFVCQMRHLPGRGRTRALRRRLSPGSGVIKVDRSRRAKRYEGRRSNG